MEGFDLSPMHCNEVLSIIESFSVQFSVLQRMNILLTKKNDHII